MPTLSVAIDASKAKTGAQQYDQASRKVQKGAKEIDAALKRTGKQQTQLANKTKKSTAALKKMFVLLGGALILRKVVRDLAEFQTTMATLAGVTQATESELARLEATARRLGATTEFTAREAGEGLLFLARAGFSSIEAIEALPGTLDLATAAALGLGEAADIVSNVLKQFNLEVERTGDVGGVLVNTANSANTNVRQLAEALKLAGPVAAAVGQSVEEAAASIGALGDAGVQGSLAGTNLRGVLSILLEQTGKNQRSFGKLGLSMDQVDPTANSLADIFELIKERGLNAALAVEIFGRRNAAAALIFSNSTDKMRALTAANVANTKAAEENAALIRDTLTGDIDKLTSALGELVQVVGESGLTAALRATLQVLTEMVNVVSGVEGAWSDASIAAKGLTLALQGLALWLAVIAATKAPFVFQEMVLLLSPLTLKVFMLAGAFKGALTAMAPFLAVLLAITAAFAVFEAAKFIGKEFENVQNFFVKFEAFLKVQASNIRFAFEVVGKGISTAFEEGLLGARIVLGTFLNSPAIKNLMLTLDFLGAISLDKVTKGLLIQGKDTFAVPKVGEATNIDAEVKKLAAEAGKREKEINAVRDRALGDIQSDFAKRRTEREAQGLAGDKIFEEQLKEDLNKLSNIFNDFNLGFQFKLFDEEDIRNQMKKAAEAAGEENARIQKKFEEEAARRKLDNERKQDEELKAAIAASQRRADDLQQGLEGVGRAAGGAFESFVFGAQSASDAVRNLIQDMIKLTFRILVTQKISAGIENLGSSRTSGAPEGGSNARGNAFNRGNVVAFAGGGVVTGPTFFPMAGGRQGLMGEAGEEAIMPLERGSNGKLGIKGGVTQINLTQNISTPNPDAFRKSQNQIARGARDSLRRTL